ncbi:hypothetical protein PoB_000367100, partial [Plakobranchus ocellatus]
MSSNFSEKSTRTEEKFKRRKNILLSFRQAEKEFREAKTRRREADETSLNDDEDHSLTKAK